MGANRSSLKVRPFIVILSIVLIFLIILFGVVLFLRVRSGNPLSLLPIESQEATPEGDESSAEDETEGDTEIDDAMTSDEISATSSEDTSSTGASTQDTAQSPPDTSATPTTMPTPTTIPTPTSQPSTADTQPTHSGSSTIRVLSSSAETNLLQNGDFELGFGDNGVGLFWQSFTNGGAKYIFTAEGWPSAIHEGQAAQRMSINEATQADRYAGLYQTVTVLPNQTYRLRLHGQVRSQAGDIKESQYGYRMQYALDFTGSNNWQNIHSEDWVELPWDEQLIDGSNVTFLSYEQTIVPPGSKLTLFIRAWQKWATPAEGQYTLDSLSLVGQSPTLAISDQSLPLTGDGFDSLVDLTDPRLWISLLFLVFLIGGAIWQNKRRRCVGQWWMISVISY